MDRNKALKKFLTLGITTLLFMVSVISSTDAEANNMDDVPIPHLEGTMGKNYWYISIVIITFDYNPEKVDYINYYLNGEWHTYTDDGIYVEDDGVYNIPWFWVDAEGETHNGFPIGFRIDRTPPAVTLSREFGSNDQVTFTANIVEPTSGVELVEFYLDDEITKTLTSPPYEYVWTGTTHHIVTVIVYDFAGHLGTDEISTPKSYNLYNALINNILQRLQQIFLFFFFSFFIV